MANVLDLKKLKREIRYDGMQNEGATRKKREPSVSESLARPFGIDAAAEETYEDEKEDLHEAPEIIAPPAKKTADSAVYIAWEAPEYERFSKGQLWFLILGLATLTLAAVAFYYGNYFFALFIVIAGILVGWFAVREPKTIHFAVTSEGVQFENKIYLFDDLKSFWIFYEPPLFKELSVESKKIFMPHLKAPLGDADPDEIRKKLLKFLPEEKQKEPFITIISHLARF